MNYTAQLDQVGFPAALIDAAAEDCASAIDYLDSRLTELSPDDIIEWIEGTIRNPRDKKLFKLRPFQKEPARAQIRRGVEVVMISGPEQFGKSICWQGPAIYKIKFIRGPKFIMYEEQKKAQRINGRRFSPMVKSVPGLRRQIEQSNITKTSSYEFENGSVDFTGAGADATSEEYRDTYCDEIDTWPLTFSKKLAQVENVEKRQRSYAVLDEGCRVMCSSCKGTEDDSAMWQYLKESSMHIFHLRCQDPDCGALIDTTQIDWKRDDAGKKRGGLRWKLDNGSVVEDSIRLHCPVCDRKHTEAEAQQMSEDGEYKAMRPQEKRKLGYIFGGLSSIQGLRWRTIAEKRVVVSETNDFEVIRTYHNSIRGVAMPVGDQVDQEAEAVVMSHCADEKVKPGDIVAILAGADTQESPWGWYWVIRGLDKQHNTHLLDCGFAHTKADLEYVLGEKKYMGRKIDFAIIDQGGTNADDVKDLASRYRHIWQYKGNARQSELWKKSTSKGQVKLLLCSAEKLQIMLLRQIYDQPNRENNYWFLPLAADMPRDDDGDFDFVTNIINVRDLGDVKNSHLRQNWNCRSHQRRDFFDCEKMLLVLLLAFKKQLANLVTNDGKTKTRKLSEIQKAKRGGKS